jgi:hypothetical protein
MDRLTEISAYAVFPFKLKRVGLMNIAQTGGWFTDIANAAFP